MTDKHLAMNIPTDFSLHVNFARLALTDEPSPRRFERDQEDWLGHRYRNCIGWLSDEPSVSVLRQLFDIECRFIALLKTIDSSVPVGPIFKKYAAISRGIAKRPDQEGSYAYVVESLGYEDAQQVPHSIADFRNASTLAEKALIADLMTRDYANAMREVANHFDYKHQKFDRGASPTYALIYCVLALAREFETNCAKGRVAAVTLSVDGSGHEGAFLDFVLAFVRVVDAGTIGLRATDGFNERVRKIAQKRAIDPGVVDLLDQSVVDADVMLEFMRRIDALKP